LVMDSRGEEIPADPHGNNIAFECIASGHPVLAVALEKPNGLMGPNLSLSAPGTKHTRRCRRSLVVGQTRRSRKRLSEGTSEEDTYGTRGSSEGC
jgi:hypothetical protein